MNASELANAAFRFVLELCALVAFAYWGFNVADALVIDVFLGLGAPLLFALLWGAFIAPKAPYRLDDPWRLFLEAALWAAAVVALMAAGAVIVGVVLASAVVLNISLMLALDQRRQGGI